MNTLKGALSQLRLPWCRDLRAGRVTPRLPLFPLQLDMSNSHRNPTAAATPIQPYSWHVISTRPPFPSSHPILHHAKVSPSPHILLLLQLTSAKTFSNTNILDQGCFSHRQVFRLWAFSPVHTNLMKNPLCLFLKTPLSLLPYFWLPDIFRGWPQKHFPLVPQSTILISWPFLLVLCVKGHLLYSP